jgi:hypothetical protein
VIVGATYRIDLYDWGETSTSILHNFRRLKCDWIRVKRIAIDMIDMTNARLLKSIKMEQKLKT